MIEIASRYLTAVREATSAEELHQCVQHSVELEFSTIPPYLTALMSLDPEKNFEIQEILRTVLLDEMLHMLINCNLLVALGGAPVIDAPAFVPRYPCPLPMSIHPGLKVGCEPFSLELVSDTFMGIEQPEVVKQFPAAHADAEYATIGLYYQALKAKITELGDTAFRGDERGQLVHDTGIEPPKRVFAITDVETATRAIDLIVTEGEGTSTSPEAGPKDDPGVIAHYYRFEQIIKRHKLVPDSHVPEGYSFSGDLVPFDASGVLPITPNQKLRDLDPESKAGGLAHQFADTFTQLLKALHQTFNGHLDAFGRSRDLMLELEFTVGQQLCATDAVSGGHPTGRKAGPPFEYLTQNN
jgi:hypothetical protein